MDASPAQPRPTPLAGRRFSILLLVLAILATTPLLAPAEPRASCIQIERVTAFAPRGEIYVQVQPTCSEDHFANDDQLIAYLEVLVSDLPPVGQDVRVRRSQPTRRLTYEFRDLDFEAGDPILVRLVRFGEILSLQSIKAP